MLPLLYDLSVMCLGKEEVLLIVQCLPTLEDCSNSGIQFNPRCKMITLEPDTFEANPEIVKHANKAHSGFAGVYGAVLVEGVVKAGDSIELID